MGDRNITMYVYWAFPCGPSCLQLVLNLSYIEQCTESSIYYTGMVSLSLSLCLSLSLSVSLSLGTEALCISPQLCCRKPLHRKHLVFLSDQKKEHNDKMLEPCGRFKLEHSTAWELEWTREPCHLLERQRYELTDKDTLFIVLEGITHTSYTHTHTYALTHGQTSTHTSDKDTIFLEDKGLSYLQRGRQRGLKVNKYIHLDTAFTF